MLVSHRTVQRAAQCSKGVHVALAHLLREGWLSCDCFTRKAAEWRRVWRRDEMRRQCPDADAAEGDGGVADAATAGGDAARPPLADGRAGVEADVPVVVVEATDLPNDAGARGTAGGGAGAQHAGRTAVEGVTAVVPGNASAIEQATSELQREVALSDQLQQLLLLAEARAIAAHAEAVEAAAQAAANMRAVACRS